jgi:hypothetical protein
MDPRNNNKITRFTSGFPFLMLITATFFQGFVFLLLNGLNIFALIRGLPFDHEMSFWDQRVLCPWWDYFVNESRLISFWLIATISLITGFLLMPVIRGTYTIYVTIDEWLTKKALYSPFKLLKDPKYVLTLDWLFSNPEARICWEWQLFQVYINWAALMNFGLFWLFSLTVFCKISIWEFLINTFILMAFVLFVHYHSILMYKIHKRYEDKAGNAP